MGVGAVAAAALPERAVARQRRRPGGTTRRVDVVVVGAGLAGLIAARTLRGRGKSVVVLEARNRVGGRNLDRALPGRVGVVELGGQWAGPGQDRVLALARELGVSTFETYSAGQNVYYHAGQRSTYSGDVPPVNPASIVELEAVITLLNQMASSVRPQAPWQAAQAGEWDKQTVASWADGVAHLEESRTVVRTAIRGVYGEEAEQISLLDLLSAVAGVGGDFNTLIGSAQSIRFVGGPQQLSQKLAGRLGTAVRLRTEVLAVDWASGSVKVHTSAGLFRGRRAVLAVPKPLLARIRFSPELPAAHDQLFQRQPMGSVLKVNAIYPQPFWRAQGLSGQAISEAGPIQLVYDNSPPSGRPGVLVGFAEGNESRALFSAAPARRRALALASLARLFGTSAANSTGYFDVLWATEPFTRGAYGSFNPPGVLTSLGAAAGDAIGPLHLAGADFSPEWPGYMEGAIRSGGRAASAVLAEL